MIKGHVIAITLGAILAWVGLSLAFDFLPNAVAATAALTVALVGMAVALLPAALADIDKRRARRAQHACRAHLASEST